MRDFELIHCCRHRAAGFVTPDTNADLCRDCREALDSGEKGSRDSHPSPLSMPASRLPRPLDMQSSVFPERMSETLGFLAGFGNVKRHIPIEIKALLMSDKAQKEKSGRKHGSRITHGANSLITWGEFPLKRRYIERLLSEVRTGLIRDQRAQGDRPPHGPGYPHLPRPRSTGRREAPRESHGPLRREPAALGWPRKGDRRRMKARTWTKTREEKRDD